MTKNRIVALDVCRGILLLCMTFNHLLAFPFISAKGLNAWAMNAAYGLFGFLSNSEGFFFVAGITAGIVYGRLVNQGRDAEIWARVWKRIKQMYLIYTILLLGVALFVAFDRNYSENWRSLHSLVWLWIVHPDLGLHYFLDHPLAGFGWGCLMIYQLPFFDLFFTYLAFLAVVPWILNQLKNGRVSYLLAASVASYVLSQYDSGMTEQIIKNYFLSAKLSWFHLGAVQILFVSGITLGFFHVRGRLFNIHKIFGAALLLLFVIFGWLYFTGAEIQSNYHLGIARLGFFTIKAYGAYLCCRILTFKPLALLGRYALPVFSYHIGLVYFLVYFLPEIAALSLLFKLACLAASIATIWIPAYLLEKRSERRVALT